jgi:hypothetical protein
MGGAYPPPPLNVFTTLMGTTLHFVSFPMVVFNLLLFYVIFFSFILYSFPLVLRSFPSFLLFYMVSVFKLTFFIPLITAFCEAVRDRKLANTRYSSVHEYISQKRAEYDEIGF